MSDKNKPINIPKKDGRSRTISSGSNSNDEASSSNTGKRQRTLSGGQQFMVVSATGSSPPKYVSLEEIMAAANGLQDMALVHQIAVDKDFKLTKAEVPDNSVEKQVRDTMHKAFWDILREEINAKPPKYNQALKLLEEIRGQLISLLLPQHTKLKQQIMETLDIELIKQQAEKGILDFPHYAQYVTSTMAKLCAPVRDDKIKQLAQTKDVVDTFKGILETLELMSLDMANFTLEMAKPEIIAHSVEYERKKFAELLKVQDDGLMNTKKWLLKHVDMDKKPTAKDNYDQFIVNTAKTAFIHACLDLMDRTKDAPFPETFMLDEMRLYDLMMRTKRCIFIGTALLITLSNVDQNLQSLQAFKETLKNHICVIVEPASTDEELEHLIPNIADQVIMDVNQVKKQQHLAELNKEQEKTLRDGLMEMKSPNHKVRSLVKQRILEFYLQILESSTAAPQKVPSGLTALQKELVAIAGQFLRLVSHNSTVFCIYYSDIVTEVLPKPKTK